VNSNGVGQRFCKDQQDQPCGNDGHKFATIMKTIPAMNRALAQFDAGNAKSAGKESSTALCIFSAPIGSVG
jgi:hypothetical protein